MKNSVIFMKSSILLMAINEDISINKLSINTDTSYAHTYKMKQLMERRGYIKSEGSKRTHRINLTDKGKEIQLKLLKINELIGS